MQYFEGEKMKVYIVIELNKDNVPKMLGVFKNRKDAEKEAYKDGNTWRNILESVVK